MATATEGDVQVESEDGVPVVLRVKRKRTEDPAESLGVFQIHSALGSLFLSMYMCMYCACNINQQCTLTHYTYLVVKKLRRLEPSLTESGECTCEQVVIPSNS